MTNTLDPSSESVFLQRLRGFIECAVFRHTILGLIVINAVILGLQTSTRAMAVIGPELILIDHIILWIFVAEIILRIMVYRLKFFRDPWGLFDLFVVAIALAPASEEFSVLRALRVLRVLRIISGVPRLRRVVGALLHAVPGIGAIGLLLGLVFYVFAVIATKLFGGAFPQWFGTIGESMYSLFQIMTLESWSMGIVRPVMGQFPQAWAFFVPFIIVSSFTVLNLFIAIIVDSMQTLHAEREDRTVEKIETVIDSDTKLVSQEISALREEILDLKKKLDQST
ncbi:MAG: ion transporter [Rhodospirillaceae bacterium]|jgi:voltage-gated sodium channel